MGAQDSSLRTVRTLVVSDLHLGGRTGVDVLRRPAAREPLIERLRRRRPARPARRHARAAPGPAREALAVAGRFSRSSARRWAGAEVVLVPGNHDHALVAPWLDAARAGRRRSELERAPGAARGDARRPGDRAVAGAPRR